MAEELESQNLMMSELMHTVNEQENARGVLTEALGALQNEKEGQDVKHDISLSHLKMKIKLVRGVHFSYKKH